MYDIDYSKYDDLDQFEIDHMIKTADAHKTWRKHANLGKLLNDFDVKGFLERNPTKRKRFLFNIEIMDVKALRQMIKCSLPIEDMHSQQMRDLGRQWAIGGYWKLEVEELRHRLIIHRTNLEAQK